MSSIKNMTPSQKNILKVYLSATEFELLEGKEWYGKVHSLCYRLATKYDLSIMQTVAAFAALSPNITFKQNVKGLENLLADWQAGDISEQTNKYTMYSQNAKKAIKFLEDIVEASLFVYSDVLTIASGHKTVSFAYNILNAHDSSDNMVTLDRWAYRVANPDCEYKGLSKNQYNRLANDYRVVANHLGIKPSELQATCWVVIRGEAY